MKKFILVFLWVIGGMCTVFSSGGYEKEAVAMRDKTAKPRTALVEADENLNECDTRREQSFDSKVSARICALSVTDFTR